jgi:signal transduction histidine kinase
LRKADHNVRIDLAPTRKGASELTRFERLLLDISTRFINPPAESFDDAIVDALRRIVEALDIDRSTLNLMSTARGRIEVAYSYAVPGVEQTPRMASGPESWPWAWSLLRADRPVVFERLDDLPTETKLDRANWERVGLKSHVTMPMFIGGELLGGLSFGTLRRERTWPDALLTDMRRIAEIFSHALAQTRTRDELDHALNFERLASRILASIFLEQTGSEGGVIGQGLRDIGQFLGVEWVSLWERLPQGNAFRTIHDWRAPGTELPGDLSDLEWLSERLVEGHVVDVGHGTTLSARADADLRRVRNVGARSLLAVPIATAGRVSVVLALGSAHEDRRWPDAMIPGVTLIAEVFASLNARLSAERGKKAAEVEAAQWRERIAHVVRVHTAGEMSAALAHEIAQPLGAIENYALAARRRMGDDAPDPKRVRDLLDKVIGQATRAGDVVTRMRGMVQRHDFDPKEIDIGRAVRDCVDMVKMDCELRNIRVDLKPILPFPTVAADEIHLQQVILNLLRNAMDAVQTLPLDATRSIAVSVGLDGADRIFVDVADRGPGIADNDLERVFESFYSTKRDGLGIGLAISRKLIEAHGGTLRAGHNPGGGAVFRLTLPTAASPA